MRLYQQRITGNSIPRAEYRKAIRRCQQVMLRSALEDAGFLRSEASAQTYQSIQTFPYGRIYQTGKADQANSSFPSQTGRPDYFAVSHGPHGKPCLTDYPDFHYNFTDSGDWLILAVSETDSEIGVDLQKVVPVRAGIMAMARRFFHPDDVALLESLSAERNPGFQSGPAGTVPVGPTPAELQTRLFFRIWTVKEAYLKYTGEGLSGGMNRYPVDFTHNKIGAASFLEAAPPEPGYYLTVCSEGRCQL